MGKRIIFSLVILTTSFFILLQAEENKEEKTLIEQSMDKETFKSCGLEKLSKGEIQNLDKWLKITLEAVYQKGMSEAMAKAPSKPQLKISGNIEQAIIIKDFDGDKVIVERANGEKWILEAKTWCSWSWRYESRKVLLKFGYVSSKLINDDGDVCEFWTEEELE